MEFFEFGLLKNYEYCVLLALFATISFYNGKELTFFEFNLYLELLLVCSLVLLCLLRLILLYKTLVLYFSINYLY